MAYTIKLININANNLKIIISYKININTLLFQNDFFFKNYFFEEYVAKRRVYNCILVENEFRKKYFRIWDPGAY